MYCDLHDDVAFTDIKTNEYSLVFKSFLCFLFHSLLWNFSSYVIQDETARKTIN